MLTLVDIANRLRSDEGIHWQPEKCLEYTLPECNLTHSNTGAGEHYFKSQLENVYAFIDYIKYLRYSEGCTIIPISTYNTRFISIWGSRKGVARGIDFMIRIGLISVESEKYHFGSYVAFSNVCKTYRYYVDNERKILGKCKELKIAKVQQLTKNFTDYNSLCNWQGFEFLPSAVRFSSKLYLKKPEYLTQAAFEEYLLKCLYENYPTLAHYQKKADDINKKYYYNMPYAIKFIPHFTWRGTKAVTKISIRATNSLCNLKKEYRARFLSENGFNMECDIKSSVPRLTISLNNGEWYDDYTKDIYRSVWDVYQNMLNPTCKKELSNDDREAIKALHLRTYFESSDKLLGCHVWNGMNKDDLKQSDKKIVYDTMEALRDAIEIVEGKLYGSEIFYVESCVYLDTLEHLLNMGYFTWQVYDCFYSKVKDDFTSDDFRDFIYADIKKNFKAFIDSKGINDTACV